MAARATKILLLVGVALAVTASSGAAASSAHTRILGVVPHVTQLGLTPHALSKAAAGPTTLTFDPNYESVINQFFTDVAAASGATDNVYSVATQYYDIENSVHVPIQYQSTFGGSYVAKDPLPANGCNDANSGLHDPYCLTDQQLENEIQAVLTAKGWHGGLDHVFALMTPNGVGSCTDGVTNQCSTNAYCAYHSDFTDSNSEDVIYLNEPYEGPYPGCSGPSQGFPNGIDADTTVNTISHEHNEAITDPLPPPDGNPAWISADLSENGDLCAFGFGAQNNPGATAYNQVINGHKYDLQEEWSNAPGGNLAGCVQRLGGPTSPQPPDDGSGPLVYNGGPVMHTNTTYAIYWLPTAGNKSRPAVTGTAAVDKTLTTSEGSWTAAPSKFSIQWQRCSSTGTGCVDISGATSTKYKLTGADRGHVVRSTVRATNVNGASAPALSTDTAVVVDVPKSTKAPHIAGRARVGRKLSGSHGSWTQSPTYRYQWLRCNTQGGSCSSIHGASHATYTLTNRDAGHRLRLRVTATNAAGSKPAVSSPTARVH
jgi:hypothetical protein